MKKEDKVMDEAEKSRLLKCKFCHKVIAKSNSKGILDVEIKCPRCKTVNKI
jgi:phage FluMu protein Com